MTQMYTPAKQRVPQTLSNKNMDARVHPVQQERQKSRSTLSHTPHNQAFRRGLLDPYAISSLFCPDKNDPASARSQNARSASVIARF